MRLFCHRLRFGVVDAAVMMTGVRLARREFDRTTIRKETSGITHNPFPRCKYHDTTIEGDSKKTIGRYLLS